MFVTGRLVGLALAAAALVGWLAAPAWSPWSGWLVLGASGLLLAAALVDAWLAPSPNTLDLTRSGERKVRLGETVSTELAVHNTGGRALRGSLRDAWAPTAQASIAGQRGDRGVLAIPAGETRRFSVELTPTRRGERPADRITVRSIGPLGLAGRQGSRSVPWSVRVLPPFSSRRHLPSRLARLRDMDGRAAIAVRAQGTEFDSLREYVPGDDVRSIDWRATARANDVMLRTWRPERDRRVLLVLDSGRTSAARIGDETRLDILLDAGLLLTALAGRAGDRVSFLAHDQQTRLEVAAGAGPGQLSLLVDALAMLEPELVETDSRGLVSAVLRRERKRALVVILGSLDRAAMEEGMLSALPTLTARHLVIFAAVRSPAAIRDVGRADQVAEVYQAASAAQDQLDRAWVISRLSRLGVKVVDAEPAEVAPKLADAYLDLKAAGKL
ncbi:MAG: DUF58 domain-containing protein [Candidatus Nanopelagicales bacterium]